jgi:hypothetical protein
MALKRITKKQIREVARVLCCIVHKGAPDFGLCQKCTHKNCYLHAIAKQALKQANVR